MEPIVLGRSFLEIDFYIILFILRVSKGTFSSNFGAKRMSVLVPARNEERNLPRLLSSLEKQEFPVEDYEILLGDDASSDATWELMQDWCKESKNRSCYQIPPSTHTKGKSNALAFLAKEASGEILVFTDADMRHHSAWLVSISNEFTDKEDVLVFSTSVEGDSFAARMQSAEWLSVLTQCFYLSQWGIPSTGLGNNMAVKRKAYEAIGGYESLPFSIVEDYQLYQELVQNGYAFRHILSAKTHAFTLPAEHLVQQRMRWLQGALESKSIYLLPGFILALFFPFLILLFLLSPIFSIVLFLTHVFFNSLILGIGTLKAGLKVRYFVGVLYTLYSYLTWPFLLVMFLLNRKKMTWKNRRF